MKNFITKLWKDESAQGMSEYMLLLLIVVGILVTFRGRLQSMIGDKIGTLEGQIGSFE